MKPADQGIHCYIVIYLVITTVLTEKIGKSTGHFRGGSRISEKGGSYVLRCGGFTLVIYLIFLQYHMKMK